MASNTFKDMFEAFPTGESGSVEIKLEETAQDLEIILPYVYCDEMTSPFNLSASNSNQVIRSIVKYQVYYGILHIELAFVYVFRCNPLTLKI